MVLVFPLIVLCVDGAPCITNPDMTLFVSESTLQLASERLWCRYVTMKLER